jgi:hypothetical protein
MVEADRHIRTDPPMGGGVNFLTNLRFFGGLWGYGDTDNNPLIP